MINIKKNYLYSIERSETNKLCVRMSWDSFKNIIYEMRWEIIYLI